MDTMSEENAEFRNKVYGHGMENVLAVPLGIR